MKRTFVTADGILSHEGNISVEMSRDEFFLKHALVSSDGIFEEIRVRWGGSLKKYQITTICGR